MTYKNLSEALFHGQLPMFMTAGEIKQHFSSGTDRGRREDSYHGQPITRWQTDREVWASKLAESETEVMGQKGYTEPMKPDAWVRTAALTPFQGNNLRYDDLSELSHSLKTEGFHEPIWFGHNHVTGMAKIEEGNHRLHAALRAGIDWVPVKLRVSKNIFGVHPTVGNVDTWPQDPNEVKGPPNIKNLFHPKDLKA